MSRFERMPDFAFWLMSLVLAVKDFVSPVIDQRIKTFRIRENMTVIDNGYGPGRFTTRFSRIVLVNGQVYAVEVQELAIETIIGVKLVG